MLSTWILWATAVAAAAAPGQDKAPKPFKIDFDIHRGSSQWDMARDNRAGLGKRDDLLNMEIQNERLFYLAELKLGSNANKVGVLVDTGSSDLWVMSKDLTCEAVLSYSKRERIIDLPDGSDGRRLKANGVDHMVGNNRVVKAQYYTEYSEGGGAATVDYAHETNTCTSYGSFATEGSDSFKVNLSAPAFQIAYADGTDANGVWGHDDVQIGSTTVKDLSFAVANESSSNVGVLGIGLVGLEVTNPLTYASAYSGFGSSSSAYTYLNLPQKLVDDGVIQKNAFSLYLGKESDSLGLILFGAVDAAKYTGDLETVPMVNSYSEYSKTPIRIEVAVSKMSLQSSSDNYTVSNNAHLVVLDTGSTYSYLSPTILLNIADTLSASYSLRYGAYLMDCINDDSISLTLDFAGKEIKIPITAIQSRISSSSDQCFLTLLQQLSSSRYILFGDNILRHMYIVYDLADYEVSFAQVKFTDDEDIKTISSSVPGANKAPNYSETSVASLGADSESNASGALNSDSSSSSGLKKNSAGVIGVPLAAVFVAVGSLFVFC